MFNKKSKHQLFILLGLYFFNTLIIDPQPSLSKPVKVKKAVIKSSNPAKDIYPDERSIINPDISRAIESAKKYQLNQPKEKSQLETSAQYETRLVRHKANTGNMPEIEIAIPIKNYLDYDADNELINVYLNQEIEFISRYSRHEKNYYPVHTEYVGRGYHSVIKIQSNTANSRSEDKYITCTNGFGVQFNYRHTKYESERFHIALLARNVYREENSSGLFSFKIPMNVDEVKKNITKDERKLNGNLKFILKLKPATPFYLEEMTYSGKECGDGDTPNGGSTTTSRTNHKLALFDLVNLKIIDFSQNKVILERIYPQDADENDSIATKIRSSPPPMVPAPPPFSIPTELTPPAPPAPNLQKGQTPIVPNPNITIDGTLPYNEVAPRSR